MLEQNPSQTKICSGKLDDLCQHKEQSDTKTLTVYKKETHFLYLTNIVGGKIYIPQHNVFKLLLNIIPSRCFF